MSIIIDTVLDHLPIHQKTTPSGWVSFNCVACSHMGTSPDTRKRAGVHVNTDGVAYSCFNCGFKASWSVGHPLNKKFKKLLGWLHVPNDKLLECIKESLTSSPNGFYNTTQLTPSFTPISLPKGAKPISEWIKSNNISDDLLKILSYMNSRNLYIDDYEWYWSNHYEFKDRLIIPFMFKNQIVGFTCRTIKENTKYRYFSEQQVGYVFNIDNQPYDNKFVIAVEGPIDAISIKGIALLGSELSGSQHSIINRLQKEVIIVPDRDNSGKKLIETAINNNWSVSFPDWDSDINDVNDAVKKYGRLFTLYSIVTNKVSSPTVIRVKQKLWFK